MNNKCITHVVVSLLLVYTVSCNVISMNTNSIKEILEKKLEQFNYDTKFNNTLS